MSELTRQQLCSALGVCESTIHRLEKNGLPFTKFVGVKRKTYNLVMCRIWLRNNSPKMLKHEVQPQSPRNFYASNSRAKQLKRAVSWADRDAIKAVYTEARRLTLESGIEHHVDHQIPLQGRLVSGLHVHNNLQVLTGSENNKKSNQFWVEE